MSRTVGSSENGAFDGAPVIEVEGHSSIVLDGSFLFSADFVRLGDDLLLRGEDGSEILLPDYFDQGTPPALETAEGARLQPATVEALAAPETVQGYAQAGALQLGQPIGEVSLLNGTARVQRPDGTRTDLHEGDPIFQGDVVSTGVGSELGIAFVDDTVFSLSANARMIINELIYNPGSTANSMGVSLIQGTFVFVTGQVAPNGGMLVDTPVGTIGIRGTTVGVEIATFGGRTIIANLTNPDTGETGSFLFSNNVGDALFSLANHYLEIRSANVAPGVPSIAAAQAIFNAFGRALNTAVSIQRQLFQQQQDDPTDEQEGQLEGQPLQAIQEAGLTQDQLDALLNAPVIETATGPQNGGTSVPGSGSGVGGSLQFESITNNGGGNGTLGGSLGGGSETLPPVGDAGTPPPPPSGSLPGEDDDDDAPPPPPPSDETPPAAAPTLVNNSLAIVEGGTTVLSADNLSASDADSDPEDLVFTVSEVTGGRFELVSNPGVAITSFTQAQVNAGAVQFVDDDDGEAPAYNVSVSDGGSATPPTAGSVSLVDPNSDPDAVDDDVTATEDSLFYGDAFADNGAGTDSDPDGDDLMVTAVNGSAAPGSLVQLSSGATVRMYSSGTFEYNAGDAFDYLGEGESATDTFTYTVSDGNGGTDTATVTVTVIGVNDAPQVTTGQGVVAPDTSVLITTAILSASDPDHSDPSEITFTVSDLVDGEVQLDGVTTTSFTLADVLAGLVTFVHNGGDNATAGFSVVAEDPEGASSIPTAVSLTVTSGFVWTNAAGNGDWNDPANWLENVVPPAGASVTVPNVGQATFSAGTLLLDSLDLTGGTLEVAGGVLSTGTVSGEGGVLVVDGGEFNVISQGDPTLAIGTGEGTLANAAVENGGEVSIVGNQALLAVGGGSNSEVPVAILTISSGGQVLVDGQGGGATVQISGTADSLGAIFVTGDGSALTVEGSAAGIEVGTNGLGELLVDDGGFVSAMYLEIGSFAEGVGVVSVGTGDEVSGARSELRIAGAFTEGGGAYVQVGGEGDGVLQVLNGALMTLESAGFDPSLVIGAGPNSVGSVAVIGTGSQLIVSNGGNASPGNQPSIVIGREGDGSLTVWEGGQVVNAANGYTFVGLEAGGSGSLLVGTDDVAGSLFDAGAALVIGAGYNFGQNEILFDAGGTGSVIVGAGGTLRAGAAQGDNVDDIFIGAGGSLTIQNGGTVIGDIRNEGGSLINGNSPGIANFGGDFAMSGGTMEVELGGLDQGSFDLYQVAGTAELNGGTIEFVILEGYAPEAGDSFAFLTAGDLDADPAMLSFVFRGVGEDFDFTVAFDGNSAEVTVLNGAGAGDSVVFLGSAGNDNFAGGVGDDRLDGGLGSDTLTGGAGADLFVLRGNAGGEGLDAADLITDFELGADALGLAGGLTAADLTVGATADGDAAIQVQSTGAYLAVLKGVSAGDIDLEQITAAVA